MGLFVDGFVIVWIGFGFSWILFACCVCLGLLLRFVLVIFGVCALGWFRGFVVCLWVWGFVVVGLGLGLGMV